MNAFSALFTIGFWEEWKVGACYALVLLIIYADFRWLLDKLNWKARFLNAALDRISQNSRRVALIWITVPILNPMAAITLHTVFTELFSSGGSSPDSVRLYSIPPNLIRRVDMLNWNGLIVFGTISSVGLFVLRRGPKK